MPLVPVLSWVSTLALNVGSTAIPNRLLDWLASGRSAEKNTARAAANQAEVKGYAEYEDSAVNRAQAQYFFGATVPGGFDAYGAFLFQQGRGYAHTFLGGPALVALGQLSQELSTNNRARVLADALLPVGGVGVRGAGFNFGTAWAAAYLAATYRVDLVYTPVSAPTARHYGRCNISVQIQNRRTGRDALARDYTLNYDLA